MRSMPRASTLFFPPSACHAPVAATQNAVVTYAASTMWGTRTQTTGLKMIACQSVGTNTPSAPTLKPTGACIQELFTMIQNEDIVVPRQTIRQEKK